MALTGKELVDGAVNALNRAPETHRRAAVTHARAASMLNGHASEMHRFGRRAAAARAEGLAERERELAHLEQVASEHAQRRASSYDSESD
jgi:hypothetical protein